MPPVVRTPNLADRADIEKKVREEFAPLARRTRNERLLLNEQWLRYDNILKVRHDSQSYHGRHRTYLAIGRRVIENWVTKLKNDIFPDSGKWFTVHAESRDSEEGVEVLTALFKRMLWDYMRIRRKSGPILRQLVTFGTSPVDIGWRFSQREVPTLEKVYNDAGGNMERAREVVKKVVDYIGPTCRPVDLFRWYVYPTSVNDISDMTLVFEDILLTKNDIERLGRTPIDPRHPELGKQFQNTEKALELIRGKDRNAMDEKFDAERRRLAARGLCSPVDTSEDPNQLLCCTKAYWRAPLQNANERGESVPEIPQWYQIVTTGDEEVVLQVRPVVFWDGEPSYLAPKFVEVWEEFYGYGLPGTFDSLAYLANDVLNQGADALTFSLNPIAAVDPGAVQDMTTIRMRPGAKWLVRRPRENIQFIEPPKESAQVAMASIQQLIALINDAANVAPFSGGGILGPRSRGRALQTAGGMAQIASEAMLQIHDVVQGVEDLFLDPMLRKMYSRTQQCLDVPVLLNVMGAAGAALIQREVTRDDLIGEFTFRWQASTSNYNAQVRGQQMIGFFQQVGQPGISDALAQENARISLKYLLRQIWSEGLGLPEPDRLIEDIQPVRAIEAEMENVLFKTGRSDEVKISPADDDMRHLKTHDHLLKPGVLDPAVYESVARHMQEHLKGLIAKQQMQQMQATGQLPAPGQGGGPAQGGGGPDQAQNPGRPATTAGPEDVNRTMGRVPGMTGMGAS